jgi:hypothetical protein
VKISYEIALNREFQVLLSDMKRQNDGKVTGFWRASVAKSASHLILLDPDQLLPDPNQPGDLARC